MSEEYIEDLAEIIDRHTPHEGSFDTGVPGLQIFKATTRNQATPIVYTPSICLLVQGKKEVLLGEEIYKYGVSEFLVVSVDLPITGKVTQASDEKPYLSLKIDIGLEVLSELLINMNYPNNSVDKVGSGLNIAKADSAIGESILHLIRMLDTPEDIPFLAAQSTREILYRFLRSEYGHLVSAFVIKGSHIERIYCAIRKIKAEFNKTITIEELAGIAGMSVSGFHAHFKAVTAMSPLKFQKRLRLTEARNLMLIQNLDTTTVAYRVGYESPSQFSREYARLFGNPPGRDISILKRKN